MKLLRVPFNKDIFSEKCPALESKAECKNQLICYLKLVAILLCEKVKLKIMQIIME